MEFVSRLYQELGPVAVLVLKAIFLSLLGIFLLIAFIVIRRWYRGRYFRRLNERTFAIRTTWDEIVSGRVAASTWRLKPLDCEIVESILLENIELAAPEELPALVQCLRCSGLLDMRAHQARRLRGWEQRNALIALGRTRAPEAIPVLAEALDAESKETRVAAVRALGHIGSAEAALPLLERLIEGELHVPEQALKNALARACRTSPRLLPIYISRAEGGARELLARVLGELASPELGDELLVLASDPLPEVRASAARALAHAPPEVAVPALSALAQDAEWFVRVRAVVGLGSIDHPSRTRPLLRALCDSNRYVRQRAAWALTQLGPGLEDILVQVVETQDNYALQAFISELERSGKIEHLVQVLEGEPGSYSAQTILRQALDAARQKVEMSVRAEAAGAGVR